MEQTTNTTTNTATNAATNQPTSVWVIYGMWTDGNGFDSSDAWVYGSYEAAVRAMDEFWQEELDYFRNEKEYPITDEMIACEEAHYEWDSNYEHLVSIDEAYNADVSIEHRDDYIYFYEARDYARVEYTLIERKIVY